MNSATIELTPAQWLRAEKLFAEAVALDEAARGRYLSSQCADDPGLRAYIEALLAADAGPGVDNAVEEAIADTTRDAFSAEEEQSDRMRGQMIGPYRVERLLGAGGMGMVYLASRADEQFDQRVAIKVGRHRLVDPRTELRLKAERQILADLDHPNIARLFDGGTMADGVPYLVMEHIDGVRIDTYCDRQRLGIADRLALFRTICGAVHYAHQNLVIHRDIKASNILVTDDGTPKLLDFGIAKLVDSEGAATQGLTREGAVVMTPENASPEQLTGGTVTTATDTYALGLLLYALMSGLRPFPTEDTPVPQLLQMILREFVPAPSVKLAKEDAAAQHAGDAAMSEALARIAADRKQTLQGLRRRLAGDVDTIVLKCLRKEPERRYRSVSELSGDIAAHLRSMPISARGDSWRYRTGKFVRRHFAAVSATAVAAGLLVALTILLGFQNQVIKQERDTARAVSRVLEDTFMAGDPVQARGLDVTAKEILAAGAARVEQELAAQPQVQSELLGTIGRVYHNLGAWEPAERMLHESLRLQESLYSKGHPSIADTRIDLARVLTSRGDYERSQQLLEDALAANLAAFGAASEPVARARFNLAELGLKTGDLDTAEDNARQSADIYTALGSDFDVAQAESLGLLGRIMQVRGDLSSTEQLLEKAIALVADAEGANHPLIAYYLQNLGVLQYSQGRFDDAEATLDQAIDATRHLLGEEHDLLAASLRHKGVVLQARGDYAAAETAMREALAQDRRTRGSMHSRVGYDLTLLGILLLDAGELAAAEASLREALEVFAASLPVDHQYTASALTAQGAVLNAAGRPADAQQVLERALQIRLLDYPDAHELVAATRTELADSETRLGNYEKASMLLAQSLPVLEDKPGRRLDRALAARERLETISASD